MPSWPVLNRLRQVMRLDLRRTLQIGDSARQLEDAVEGAGAHAQLRHAGAQQALAGLVQAAVLVHFRRAHVSIAYLHHGGTEYTEFSLNSLCPPCLSGYFHAWHFVDVYAFEQPAVACPVQCEGMRLW